MPDMAQSAALTVARLCAAHAGTATAEQRELGLDVCREVRHGLPDGTNILAEVYEIEAALLAADGELELAADALAAAVDEGERARQARAPPPSPPPDPPD